MSMKCKRCGKKMDNDPLNTGLGPECNRYLFSIERIEDGLDTIEKYEEFYKTVSGDIEQDRLELALIKKEITYEEAVEKLSEKPGFPIEAKEYILSKKRFNCSGLAYPYSYEDLKVDKEYDKDLRDTLSRMPVVHRLEDNQYYRQKIKGRWMYDDKDRLVNGASLVWQRVFMNPQNGRKYNEDLRTLQIHPVGVSTTFLRRDGKAELGSIIVQSAHESADKNKVIFITIDSTKKGKGVNLKIGFGEIKHDKLGRMRVEARHRPFTYLMGHGTDLPLDVPGKVTTILKSYLIDNDDLFELHPDTQNDREFYELLAENTEEE